MIRQYVSSSNVEVVGHHRGKLYVKFLNGSAYAYDNVPLPVYLDLVAAESVGKHFCANIKGKYNFSKLDYDPFELRKAA